MLYKSKTERMFARLKRASTAHHASPQTYFLTRPVSNRFRSGVWFDSGSTFQGFSQLTWLHDKAVGVAAIFKLNGVTIPRCDWDQFKMFGHGDVKRPQGAQDTTIF